MLNIEQYYLDYYDMDGSNVLLPVYKNNESAFCLNNTTVFPTSFIETEM